MLAGLGRVLYWACMAVAVALFVLAVYAPFRGDYLVTPLFLVLALLVGLMGRVFLLVFAGRWR